MNMRKHLPLFVSGVVLSTLLSAHPALAAGWMQQTSPTTADLTSVDCATASACIAVGYQGAVAYTTDKYTWQLGTSGSTTKFFGIDMVSTSTAYMVGASGSIRKTTDGGATWAALSSGTTELLIDVFMVSSTTGWVVGANDTILKTTDGGATWVDSAGTATGDFYAIDVVSSTVAWVVGTNGTVYRTVDGGTTWTSVPYPSTENIFAINAISSSLAMIAGENALFAKTTNSGATWTAVATPTGFSATETLSGMSFWSDSYGNIIGSDGGIATTSNAGATFTEDVTSFTGSPALTDVATPAVGARYVVGWYGFIGYYDNYGPSEPTDLTVDSSPDGDDATNDTTPTMTWTAGVDEEGSVIAYYEYSLDDGGLWTATTGTATHTFSELSAGSYTVDLRGIDEFGNNGDIASLDFVIDTTAPTVGTASPTSATTAATTSFTVSASDAGSGVTACTLYRGTTSMGAMRYSSTTGYWSVSTSIGSAGTYSLFATCEDTAGNSTSGAAVTLTVSGTSSSDNTAPNVGGVSPTSATKNVALTLSNTYSDAVGVTSCNLYVNGSNVGIMTLSSGTARKTYTFVSNGDYSVYASCQDAAGNVANGTTRTVTVSATSTATEEEVAVDEAAEGDLMKMACGDGADVNDPCRAVYYYGNDGKRHAFPNENVFFTWYTNFDDVVIVTDDYMAAVTLGRNVTYHPGTTMVKFITVNTVYAVGTEGELRAIDSEDTAISIWGSNWNTQVDDISDAFYGNYTFGEDIDSTSDFDPDEVEDSVDSIDDIL